MLRTGPARVLSFAAARRGRGGPGPRRGQFRLRPPDAGAVVRGRRAVAAQQPARLSQRRGVAGPPVLDLGLLGGPGPLHPHHSQPDRRPGRRIARPRRPGRRIRQMLLLLAGPLRLSRGPLGGQPGQRRGDPLSTPPRPPGIFGHLITAHPRAEQVILGGIGLGMPGHGLRRQPAQPLLGPVRRLRRARRDLHPVQRDHAQPRPSPAARTAPAPRQRTPPPPPGTPPGTGQWSHDRAGSPRRSPGTPHRSRTTARSAASWSPDAHTPTPAPPPACPGHNRPRPPRRSCARHETCWYPDDLPPP